MFYSKNRGSNTVHAILTKKTLGWAFSEIDGRKQNTLLAKHYETVDEAYKALPKFLGLHVRVAKVK